MGYAYIATQGKIHHIYLDSSVADIPSPFNFLSEDPQTQHTASIPFSMSMTTVLPDSDIPYHITLFSPEYYFYAELTQDEYRQRVLNRGQHQHNTYEIVYTREGEFFQQIEARRYKYPARSCCMLNRNIRHREEYLTASSTVNLSLSADFLQELLADNTDSFFIEDSLKWRENEELQQFINNEFQEIGQRKNYINFIPTQQALEENDIIHDLLDQLAHIIISPTPGCSFAFRGVIWQILYHLCDQDRYSTTLMNMGTEAEDRVFNQVTQLMEQTHGRITRSELIEQLNYSGSYINRIINKYTGMNITQYGSHFAMQYAAWLFAHTKLTISEIIVKSGFTDRTHFYQLFKKEFNVTPRQFRKQYVKLEHH